MPRIPLHALGAAGAFVRASADAAASAETPFCAIPDNDLLGIIAGYLPQADQLVMREIDASVRGVVDPTIHTLQLTGRAACEVLRKPHVMRNLRELVLSDCRDEDLNELADILGTMPNPDFDLVIQGHNNGVSVDGLRHLVARPFSRLALHNIVVSADMNRALAGSRAPLSIHLPYFGDDESDVFGISQLPKLQSLTVGNKYVTPETIEALRSHPGLEALHVDFLSGTDVSTLATSAHLRSLTIEWIPEGAAAALRALADNSVLTSLSVGIPEASSFAALSSNVTLQTLTVVAPAMPSTLLSSLTTLSALENLRLCAAGDRAVRMSVNDVAALSAKPLTSLSLVEIEFDSVARSLLATAQTKSLQLEPREVFERAHFDALSQNRSMTSLSIRSTVAQDIRSDDVLAFVTSCPPQLASFDIIASSETPDIAKAAIQAIWMTSGRELPKLALDIR